MIRKSKYVSILLILCVSAGISMTIPTSVDAEVVKSDNGHCGEWTHSKSHCPFFGTSCTSNTYARKYGHSATAMVGENSNYAEADPDVWAKAEYSGGGYFQTAKAFWDIF